MSFSLLALTALMLSVPVPKSPALVMQPVSGSKPLASLSGTWRSAPDEIPLNSTFDESVWGKNAKSIRTVQLAIRPTGDATLTVTRKVIDARGRTVPGSTSIERAELTLGPVQNTTGVRSDLAVTVKKAERHYPDDPEATWSIERLQVTVTTFTDDPGMLEVRLDFPEGTGSFWEALHRGTRKPVSTS
jgi:hypothetical protein